MRTEYNKSLKYKEPFAKGKQFRVDRRKRKK